MTDDLKKRLRTSLSMLAQEEAADRIEELESAVDWQRGRAETAEAKLAKAVEALMLIAYVEFEEKLSADKETARITLAELK